MLPYIKVTHHRYCHIQVKNLLSFRVMFGRQGADRTLRLRPSFVGGCSTY